MGDASRAHGEERVDTGFGLLDMVSEYRALRASVLRLWSQDGSAYSAADVRDMVRFNEAIDQSLAIATQAYTESVERSREMFQAMLWHDLRNPLNAVRMAASLLDEEAPLGEDDRRLVTQIRASSEAMNQLISDLIDLSSGKIRAGIPVFPADMDLGKLCQQVAAETRASSPDRPVTVRTDGDLRGRWDAGRLRQVLSNLLGNAVHHGEGPIDLWATGSAPAGVELGVRNGGPPIPKEVLPRLFDPMARARSGQNRRPGSLGLGLHIVSEIVSGHGGSVEVESSPETGTVVTVRLPRSAPAPDAA